jgi:beta-fructofuranosidase
MQLEGFRDPCVWQEAGEWRMILGSGLTDVGGAVLIYRSKSLNDWQYMGILFQVDSQKSDPLWTGNDVGSVLLCSLLARNGF